MTTKNGDMPAMPIMHEQAQDADMWGLTKREMMAMAAMQGLLANNENGPWYHHSIPSSAVELADSLLSELERTNG